MLKYLSRFTPIARGIINKEKQNLPKYMPVHSSDDHVVEKISRSLSNPLCGVHVLHYKSSKSIYLESCNRLMKDRKITGVLIGTNTYDNHINDYNGDLLKWFKSHYISTSEPSLFINDLLKKNDRVAIILDGLEYIEKDKMEQVNSFIVSLAETSVMTKQYSVLVTCTSMDFYIKVLDLNGRQKIQAV